MEVVLLDERDVSVSDLQEPLHASPCGAIARGDTQSKRLARVRRAQVRRMAMRTRKTVLVRRCERRSATDTTVEFRPEIDAISPRVAGAARCKYITRWITAPLQVRFNVWTAS